MSNFTYFIPEEVEHLSSMQDEAHAVQSQTGSFVDKDTGYTLTPQGAFRLRVARELIAASPSIYGQLKDPKCVFRLVTLDYRLKTFFENLLRQKSRKTAEAIAQAPQPARARAKSRARATTSVSTRTRPQAQSPEIIELSQSPEPGTAEHYPDDTSPSPPVSRVRRSAKHARRVITSPVSEDNLAQTSENVRELYSSLARASTPDNETLYISDSDEKNELVAVSQSPFKEGGSAIPSNSERATRAESMSEVPRDMPTLPQPRQPLFRPSSSQANSQNSLSTSNRSSKSDVQMKDCFAPQTSTVGPVGAGQVLSARGGVRSPPLPYESELPRRQWIKTYQSQGATRTRISAAEPAHDFGADNPVEGCMSDS